MKIKLDRIISIATLLASVVAIVLVLKRPAPVAQPQSPAAIAANAQSFGQKMDQLEQAAQQTSPTSRGNLQAAPLLTQETIPAGVQPSPQTKAEVHVNSDEVGAALAQAMGAGGVGGLSP